MQNVAIFGVIAILLIGGVAYFSSTADTTPAVDYADNQATSDTEDMSQVDEMPETNMTEDEMEMETQADIVTTAVNTPTLSTLVTAVTEAELVATLQGDGPFTVFAPTDAAFAALPAGTLETLLDPTNQGQLQSILTYHVVPGAITASELEDGMTVETVNGETITINVGDAGVTINGAATVTTADIVTANGVVHVIDNVLLPESAQ